MPSKKSHRKIIFACLVMAGCLSSAFGLRLFVHASTIDDLKQQIDSHNQMINQLQQEIAQYNAILDKTSAEAKTLQSTINVLTLNAKKLDADIKLTQAKISSTDLSIEELSHEITDKEQSIDENDQALASSIRTIYETDETSMIEQFLSDKNISEFWSDVDTLGQFQKKVQDQVASLKNLKQGLEANKAATTQKKNQLVDLKTQLSDQKTVVEVNKKTKAQLLAETKSKESSYKQIIADKMAKERAFESELTDFESQLNLAINPNSIPKTGTGVLSWPLNPHTITQYFGNTAFALAHAAVYNGSGHNGIDIAAPIGTPIHAALSGTIQGTGNTDAGCPASSYGKWVLIKHSNGLSTLYAHLSVISSQTGQSVGTGDIIGYSGMTGYATGPHLHFTVYASQGVEILTRASKSCRGSSLTMPVADLKAYLNPLSYL